MSIPVDLALRILALCVVLAGTETLHGILRTVWLVPRIGKERALALSIVSGSLLAFAVCWWVVPGVGLRSLVGHWALGVTIAMFMAAFDLGLGRWVLRRSWSKALQDFNPATGNYLIFGLLLMTGMPAAVATLRGLV